MNLKITVTFNLVNKRWIGYVCRCEADTSHEAVSKNPDKNIIEKRVWKDTNGDDDTFLD